MNHFLYVVESFLLLGRVSGGHKLADGGHHRLVVVEDAAAVVLHGHGDIGVGIDDAAPEVQHVEVGEFLLARELEVLGQGCAQQFLFLLPDADDEPVVAHQVGGLHHLHEHQTEVAVAHGHGIDIELGGFLTEDEHSVDDGHAEVAFAALGKTLDGFDGALTFVAFEERGNGRSVGQCDFSERYHCLNFVARFLKICAKISRLLHTYKLFEQNIPKNPILANFQRKKVMCRPFFTRARKGLSAQTKTSERSDENF